MKIYTHTHVHTLTVNFTRERNPIIYLHYNLHQKTKINEIYSRLHVVTIRKPSTTYPWKDL